MPIATVAIPRGPRVPLSYAVPTELLERVVIGCRVLVPLGQSNRRTTAYVIGVQPDETADAVELQLKPLIDVLDNAPLFDAELLSVFRFIASYYRASLGDVIRAGLPAAALSASRSISAMNCSRIPVGATSRRR